MAKADKVTLRYQEKYKKGNVVNEKEVLNIITNNISKVKMELRERTIYSDGKEEMIISILI